MIIFEDEIALQHIVPQGHPERPERWQAIHNMMQTAFPAHARKAPPQASLSQLSLVHDGAYLEQLYAQRPESGLVTIDGDTFLSPQSLAAAERGAGAACAAVDAVLTGEDDTAFVAMRPPGHHAEPDRAMGFCLFSNAAIAAKYAQSQYGAGNVAVLDFDVHHGNGTQAAFWDSADCFYASTHEMPLFPGSGSASETGAGSIFNQPLRASMDGGDMMDAWMPLLAHLEKAKPDLIIISAGFDAHKDDPLANIELQSSDFYELTARIVDLANRTSNGKVVSLLEGGYNLEKLAESASHHLRALSSTSA